MTNCFYCAQALLADGHLILADLRRRGHATVRTVFHTDCFRAFVASGGRRPLEEGAYEIVASDQRLM